jgi:beta-glucanase (GH16 family)
MPDRNVSLAIPVMFCCFCVLSLISCKKTESVPLGVATVNSLSQERTRNTSTFRFQVQLDQPAKQEVSIKYTTLEATAKANTDFIPKSGTLVIPVNSSQGFIDVDVTGDSLRKADQLFYVQFSEPKGCTLTNDKASGIIINSNLTYLTTPSKGYSTPLSYPGYQLVWNDEFNDNSINTNNWGFDIGNNNGWGNNELEYYTDRTQNAFVSAGNLIIEARNEVLNGKNYTSARMLTKGKKVFTYGRVDIRAKLPKGKGIWPALWMLGKNIDQVSWPACGEIDIMELLGQQVNKVYGTIHWGSSTNTYRKKEGSYILSSGGFDEDFHVYSLIWTADAIKILVDDQQYFQALRAEITDPNPFNSEFFFLFNIAVGGNWPGAPDNTTVFPQRMFVDYIRVFQ